MNVADMIITPELAEKYLSKNTSNRPLRPKLVNTYANDMRNGRWQMNGETIKLSKDDELLDGQHRLSAIIACKRAIRMAVVRNLEKESFHTIDTGMRRTGAQILGIAGFANNSTLAAAARVLHLLESKEKGAGFPRSQVSPAALLETISKHPLLDKYLKLYRESKTMHNILPSGAIGVFVLAAEKYGPSVVDLFVSQFATGEGLTMGDPVYMLREKLAANKGSTTRFQLETMIGMTIKCVRAFVEDRKVGKLQMTKSEIFPDL